MKFTPTWYKNPNLSAVPSFQELEDITGVAYDNEGYYIGPKEKPKMQMVIDQRTKRQYWAPEEYDEDAVKYGTALLEREFNSKEWWGMLNDPHLSFGEKVSVSAVELLKQAGKTVAKAPTEIVAGIAGATDAVGLDAAKMWETNLSVSFPAMYFGSKLARKGIKATADDYLELLKGIKTNTPKGEMGEAAALYRASAQNWEATLDKWMPDVDDNIKAHSTLVTVGSMAGQIGGSLVLAAATSSVGGLPAVASVFGSQQFYNLREEYLAKGYSLQSANIWAGVGAIFEGGLEALGFNQWLKYATLKPSLRNHLIAGLMESSQEMLQTGAEAALTNFSGVREETLVEVLAQIAIAGVAGFIPGAGISMVSGGIGIRTEKAQYELDKAIEQTPAPVQPTTKEGQYIKGPNAKQELELAKANKGSNQLYETVKNLANAHGITKEEQVDALFYFARNQRVQGIVGEELLQGLGKQIVAYNKQLALPDKIADKENKKAAEDITYHLSEQSVNDFRNKTKEAAEKSGLNEVEAERVAESETQIYKNLSEQLGEDVMGVKQVEFLVPTREEGKSPTIEEALAEAQVIDGQIAELKKIEGTQNQIAKLETEKGKILSRGYIDMGGTINKIVLSNFSDVTTIKHELMHHWQNVIKLMAAKGNKKAQALQKQIDKIIEDNKDYVKQDANKAAEVLTEAYELWLHTGVVTDTEQQGLFNALKQFFQSVYNSAKEITGIRMNAEIDYLFRQMTGLAPIVVREEVSAEQTQEGDVMFQPLIEGLDTNQQVPVVDLSSFKFDSSQSIKEQIKNKLDDLEKQSPFSTQTLKVLADVVTSRRKKHIKDSSRHDFLILNRDAKKRHDKEVLNLDTLIQNAVLCEIAPNNKKSKKPNVENYYYFYVPVKLGQYIYTVKLAAEEMVSEKGIDHKTVHLYDVLETKKQGTQARNTSGSYGFPASISITEMLQNVNDVDGNPYILPDMVDIDGVMRHTKNSEGRQIAHTLDGIKNFYKWFGDSKVVDEQGRPLVVYHGTNADFDTFDKTKIGSSTKNKGIFGNGFYFTDDIKLAEGYNRKNGLVVKDGTGKVMPAYLTIKKPFFWNKKDSASIAEKMGFPKSRIKDGKLLPLVEEKQIFSFTKKLKDNGYDGVVFEYKNGVKEISVFNPTQIKSVDNQGTFSPSTGNIYLQTIKAQQTGSKAADAKPSAEQVEKDLEIIKNNGVEKHQKKAVFGGIGDWAKYALISVRQRAGAIDPKLKAFFDKLDYFQPALEKKFADYTKGFFKKYKDLTETEKNIFDYYVYNQLHDNLKSFLKEKGMEKEYQDVRSLLNFVFSAGNMAGVDMGFIEEYFPTSMIDHAGFMDHMKGTDKWSYIEKSLREADPDGLWDSKQRAEAVNKLLRGYKLTDPTFKPSNAKERTILYKSPELMKFYEHSDVALMKYLQGMSRAIAINKAFGKGKGFNTDETIGAIVLELIESGTITRKEEEVVRNLLKSRLSYRATPSFINMTKNIGYLSMMNNITSAVTQLGDLYAPFYKYSFGTAIEAIFGKKELTRKDLGLDKIWEEFSNEKWHGIAVDKLFKAVGLDMMDAFGKKVSIQASLLNLRKQAESGDMALLARVTSAFGKDGAKVLKDIKEGKLTEEVKILVFSDLADTQPIGKSGVPEGYLNHPNLRIFYQLKTFMLNQISLFYADSLVDIQKGIQFKNKKQFLRGVGNGFKLLLLLTAGNATADTLKNLIMGREIDLEDTVVSNLLWNIGVSKYTFYKGQREGYVWALFSNYFMPPQVGTADDVYRDARRMAQGKQELKDSMLATFVPFGRMYYWWFGGGSEQGKKRKEKLTKKVNAKNRMKNKNKRREK